MKKPPPSTLLSTPNANISNPTKPLEHVTYSVLALGDTNYDQFCESGMIINKKLHDWGAVRGCEVMCADEATGLESTVEPWLDCVLVKLEKACKGEVVAGATDQGVAAAGVVGNNEDKMTKNENGGVDLNNTQEETKDKKNEVVGTLQSTSGTKTSISTSPTPLYILYGSATGNAEHIAKDITSTYEMYLKNPDFQGYFTSVICCDLNSYKKKCLDAWITPPVEDNPSIKHGVIIVCSTTGNADAPENADRFIRWLKRKTTTSAASFGHVAYAVLGLGDTNYDVFCAMGKVIDKRIHELGGVRALKVGLADEATGLEDVVEPWAGSVIGLLASVCKGEGQPVAMKNEESTSSGTTAPPAPIKAAAAATTTPTTAASADAPSTSVPKKVKEQSSFESIVEEKKMEVEETFEQPLPATDITTSGSSSSFVFGVSTIRKLLSITSDTPLPTAVTSSLPKMVSSLSSCELIHDGDMKRTRGDSIADNMTVSSGSSGFLYTAAKPYESHILDARYLTNTNVDCAQKVASEILISSGGEECNDETLVKAMKMYEDHFPLTGESNANEQQQQQLQYEKNGKRVIEITLSLPDDFTLEYEPGDSVGLIVPNTPQSTNFVLEMLRSNHGILPSQKVSVDAAHPITVEEAIRCTIDLSSPMKKKRMFLLSMYATDAEEEKALRLLSGGSDINGVDLFQRYIEDQSRSVVDILKEFPSCQSITLEGLLGCLPAIPSRYYSVCSSPLYDRQNSNGDNNGYFHLKVAFSVVDYMTPMIPEDTNSPRRMGGLATRRLECVSSPFLCNQVSSLLVPKPFVQIFPKPTHEFRLPSDMSTPLILIGPGTGIAPFIGFLSHRQAQLASLESTEAAEVTSEGTWRGGYELGLNELSLSKGDARGLNLALDYMRKHQQAGEIDLFFGCRYSEHDYLYKNELEEFKSKGILTNLYTAFSRDDSKKTYVQTIMQTDDKCGKRLVDMIMEKQASVYICGDGNAMGKEVQDTIVTLLAKDLIEKGSCKDVDEGRLRAAAHVDQMKTFGRFVLDIWS